MNDVIVQVAQDAPFDSVWAATPGSSELGSMEQVMLADDKLMVVFAVVLIIWLGICYFIIRTDRRLAALEKQVEANKSSAHHE